VNLVLFGTRGSCPCDGDHCGYGGNTSCVVVETQDSGRIVLDAGTGLRAFGRTLLAGGGGKPTRLPLLLSHLHFDHVLGLPFFEPLLQMDTVLEVFGPAQQRGSLADALSTMVRPPFFPIGLQDFPATVHALDVGAEDFALDGGAKVRARWVPHLGPTLGYRLEVDGQALAYVPDHQAPPNGDGVPDAVLELCEGVDVLLHDAQYSVEELARRADWGHSSIDYAVRVATESRVRHLVLFHHDPTHSDADIHRLLLHARKLAQGSPLTIAAARQGDHVRVDRPLQAQRSW